MCQIFYFIGAGEASRHKFCCKNSPSALNPKSQNLNIEVYHFSDNVFTCKDFSRHFLDIIFVLHQCFFAHGVVGNMGKKGLAGVYMYFLSFSLIIACITCIKPGVGKQTPFNPSVCI